MDLASAAGESVSHLPGARGNTVPVPDGHMLSSGSHQHHGEAPPGGTVHTENALGGETEHLGNALGGPGHPEPVGVHVDLPFEHGNMNPFPVIHRGSEPHASVPQTGEPPFDAGSPSTDPASSTHSGDIPFFHGLNVHADPHTKVDSVGFVDLVPLENVSPDVNILHLGHESASGQKDELMHSLLSNLGDLNFGTPIDTKPAVAPVVPNDTKGPGVAPVLKVAEPMPVDFHNDIHSSAFGNSNDFFSQNEAFDVNGLLSQPGNIFETPTPIDVPIKKESIGGSHDVHLDAIMPSLVDLNIAPTVDTTPDIVHGSPLGSVHIDLPGEHGNSANVPVVHRDNNNNGFIPGQNDIADVQGSHREPRQATWGVGLGPAMPFGDVHVDHPGQHGNTGQTPVIHRPVADQGAGTSFTDVHVDHPGQHGHMGDTPVIHRPGIGQTGSGLGPATTLNDVHVDHPGQHGNLGNAPVIHRPGQLDGGFGLGTTFNDVHVDNPGQHGHIGDTPIVHRPGGGVSGFGLGPATPFADVHVDHPGQHGHTGDTPVVHRPGGSGIGMSSGAPFEDVHVDHPGQHGHTGNTPVLHRPGGHRPRGHVSGFGFGPATPFADVHVDHPGQHGHTGDTPVVHRPGGSQPGIGISPGAPFEDVHVDHPGQHGHTGNTPVLHRPGGHRPGDSSIPRIAEGASGRPGVKIVQVDPATGRTVTVLSGNAHLHDPTLPHIDRHGQHDNFLGEDVLHIPDARRPTPAHRPLPRHPFGPMSLGPIAPTGVLPGTPNVPFPPRWSRPYPYHYPNIHGGGIVGGRGRLGRGPSRLMSLHESYDPHSVHDVIRDALAGRPIGGSLMGSLRRTAATVDAGSQGRHDHSPIHDHLASHGSPRSIRIGSARRNPFAGLLNTFIGSLLWLE